jgi:hypothetical protein
MAGDTVDHPESEDRESERHSDREAAWPRDRTRMHATAARHVEQRKTLREPAHEWRDRSGKKECDDSGADEEEAGHSAER